MRFFSSEGCLFFNRGCLFSEGCLFFNMGCFFFLGVSFILRGVYFHRSRFIGRACVVKYCRIHHVSSIQVRSSLLLVMDNSVRAARNLLENALSMMNQQETNPRKLVHRIACVFVNNKWRACVFVK